MAAIKWSICQKPLQPSSPHVKYLNALTREVIYLEGKEHAIKDRTKKIQEFKHYTTPVLIDDELLVKSIDDWRKEYNEFTHEVMHKIGREDHVKKATSFKVVDKIVEEDIMQGKFISDVRNIVDSECREDPARVQTIHDFEWPSSFYVHSGMKSIAR